MSKYSDRAIQNAVELRRRERYSFVQLQQITSIPASTIRNWCQGDYLGSKWDTLLVTNDRKRQEIKTSEVFVVHSLGIISSQKAKLFASLLYWCEGSKYPSTNCLAFVNSDPGLIKFFLTLLRKAFPLDESKLRIRLQIHDVQDFISIRGYWSRLLNIPLYQIMKPTVTRLKGGKHRKEYYGTCTLKYHDYRIQLKLIGIYESLLKNSV